MKAVQDLQGILVVDKPQGMTSHDVVSRVRKRFKMRRVGHAGTLDPLATGVLVILLGKGTKLFPKFEAFDKSYKATMILGTKTTTADIEGKITENAAYEQITRPQVENVMKDFVGEVDQVPPMVSAIKYKGKKLYELARKGIEVERQPRRIRIDKLELVDFDLPRLKIYLECSKGTYVRQLAEDIAQRCGTVACIERIERTQVGPFRIEEATGLDDISEDLVRNWDGN